MAATPVKCTCRLVFDGKGGAALFRFSSSTRISSVRRRGMAGLRCDVLARDADGRYLARISGDREGQENGRRRAADRSGAGFPGAVGGSSGLAFPGCADRARTRDRIDAAARRPSRVRDVPTMAPSATSSSAATESCASRRCPPARWLPVPRRGRGARRPRAWPRRWRRPTPRARRRGRGARRPTRRPPELAGWRRRVLDVHVGEDGDVDAQRGARPQGVGCTAFDLALIRPHDAGVDVHADEGAPHAAAMPNAERASLRSTFTPTGTRRLRRPRAHDAGHGRDGFRLHGVPGGRGRRGSSPPGRRPCPPRPQRRDVLLGSSDQHVVHGALPPRRARKGEQVHHADEGSGRGPEPRTPRNPRVARHVRSPRLQVVRCFGGHGGRPRCAREDCVFSETVPQRVHRVGDSPVALASRRRPARGRDRAADAGGVRQAREPHAQQPGRCAPLRHAAPAGAPATPHRSPRRTRWARGRSCCAPACGSRGRAA